VRLNRVIRDIPNFYISGGVKDVGMRQTLQIEMAKRGLECKCIRCREVKKRKIDHSLAVLTERIYESSGGTEYYISFETADKKILFGFLRLRLCDRAGMPNTGDEPVFPELIGSALIRELHVYGQTVPVRRTDDKTSCSQVKHQHVGFGTRLVRRAFEIAQEKGFEKIAVISGVGVKNYYKRFGFEDENMFMTYVFPKVNPTHEIIRTSIDGTIEATQHKICKFINDCIVFVLNYDVMFTLALLWYCFYRNGPC
jgi:ELP3 family radical SAM enzyme/protein acetyltransferase